jgi:hypothetical protein
MQVIVLRTQRVYPYPEEKEQNADRVYTPLLFEKRKERRSCVHSFIVDLLTHKLQKATAPHQNTAS